jgi:hypothetical protein
MSGFADERQAIEARLAANFSAIPIRYENAPFQEMATAYCAVFVRRGAGNQITLGPAPQLNRWAGLIIVQVFVPEDTGTQTIAGYCDSIADVFRRQEFSVGASGLIRCRVPNVTTVGTRDGWFQMNVEVPYIRDKSA